MAGEISNATVLQRAELNPDLIVIRVRPDGPMFDFKAGQYTVLGLPGSSLRATFSDPETEPPPPDRLIRRAYSISSSSKQNEYLEFYISLVRSGQLTPRLFVLEEGDRIWLGSKAVGQFTLSEVDEDHDLLLISTGTGLAPYISMIRSAHRCGVGRKYYVLHGARYSWDLGFRSELEALDHGCGTFAYLPTVTGVNKDQTWQGHAGRIQKLIEDGTLENYLGGQPDPDKLSVFVCGNPEMVRDVQRRFEEMGFRLHSRKEAGSLHIERYW